MVNWALYPITKYTTYSNPSYLDNLNTSNEWYDWVLAKVRKDSIGTGGIGSEFGENSSYYSSWRMAHLFQKEGSGNAIRYLKQLDIVLDARPIARHNQGQTKENDAFNTMKKMLLLWESKRRIEIPIEEAQRVIQEKENQRLQEKENQEKILADQQKVINQIIITPISDITNPIITVPQGYHKMPDGTIMKDSEHKTEREKLIEKSSIAILVIGGIGLYLALRFKK